MPKPACRLASCVLVAASLSGAAPAGALAASGGDSTGADRTEIVKPLPRHRPKPAVDRGTRRVNPQARKVG